jgi:hypothetical protein
MIKHETIFSRVVIKKGLNNKSAYVYKHNRFYRRIIQYSLRVKKKDLRRSLKISTQKTLMHIH